MTVSPFLKFTQLPRSMSLGDWPRGGGTPDTASFQATELPAVSDGVPYSCPDARSGTAHADGDCRTDRTTPRHRPIRDPARALLRNGRLRTRLPAALAARAVARIRRHGSGGVDGARRLLRRARARRLPGRTLEP